MEAKKILVIDDEKPILDMLKQGLEMNPEFDVKISEDVEEYEKKAWLGDHWQQPEDGAHRLRERHTVQV